MGSLNNKQARKCRYKYILKITDEEILKLHNQGLLQKEIAEIAGCKPCTITNHLTKMGVYTYRKDLQPKMLELHKQGYYDKEIAEILGCTRENVTHFLNKQGIINRRNKIDDIDLRNRISQSLIGKYVGEDNPNYKGYSEEKILARGIFKTFSKRILRKYNYTCQCCGKRGGNLEVHHIKPFHIIFDEFLKTSYSYNKNNFYNEIMNYKDFTDENNMIVLCQDCHKKVHYSDNHELSPYRWESATTIEKDN